MQRSAFTLMELLIVVAIMLILAAILVPLGRMVIWQSKALKTDQRLQTLQAAIHAYGGAEILHRQVLFPALLAAGETATGVVSFRVTIGQGAIGGSGGGYLIPKVGQWLDGTRPWAFTFPWGKPAFAVPASDTTTAAPWDGAATLPPLTRDLRDLSVLANVALLQAAGIIDSSQQWSEDRSANQPWNDAWGHPLVVAFGIFQPPLNEHAVTHWRGAIGTEQRIIAGDLYVKHAKEVYGFDRAIYLSVAAAGDHLRTPLTGDVQVDAGNLWQQATDTCGGEEWTSAAWTTPPSTWRVSTRRGHKTVNGVLERSFLTAPIELR